MSDEAGVDHHARHAVALALGQAGPVELALVGRDADTPTKLEISVIRKPTLARGADIAEAALEWMVGPG